MRRWLVERFLRELALRSQEQGRSLRTCASLSQTLAQASGQPSDAACSLRDSRLSAPDEASELTTPAPSARLRAHPQPPRASPSPLLPSIAAQHAATALNSANGWHRQHPQAAFRSLRSLSVSAAPCCASVEGDGDSSLPPELEAELEGAQDGEPESFALDQYDTQGLDSDDHVWTQIAGTGEDTGPPAGSFRRAYLDLCEAAAAVPPPPRPARKRRAVKKTPDAGNTEGDDSVPTKGPPRKAVSPSSVFKTLRMDDYTDPGGHAGRLSADQDISSKDARRKTPRYSVSTCLANLQWLQKTCGPVLAKRMIDARPTLVTFQPFLLKKNYQSLLKALDLPDNPTGAAHLWLDAHPPSLSNPPTELPQHVQEASEVLQVHPLVLWQAFVLGSHFRKEWRSLRKAQSHINTLTTWLKELNMPGPDTFLPRYRIMMVKSKFGPGLAKDWPVSNEGLWEAADVIRMFALCSDNMLTKDPNLVGKTLPEWLVQQVSDTERLLLSWPKHLVQATLWPGVDFSQDDVSAAFTRTKEDGSSTRPPKDAKDFLAKWEDTVHTYRRSAHLLNPRIRSPDTKNTKSASGTGLARDGTARDAVKRAFGLTKKGGVRMDAAFLYARACLLADFNVLRLSSDSLESRLEALSQAAAWNPPWHEELQRMEPVSLARMLTALEGQYRFSRAFTSLEDECPEIRTIPLRAVMHHKWHKPMEGHSDFPFQAVHDFLATME